MTDTPEVTIHPHSPHVASAHESGMTFESAMDAVRLGYAVRRESWLKVYCIFKIYYRDQPYLVKTMNPGTGCLRPYICGIGDREAKDWEIVEHPALWDKTDPRYEGIPL